MNEDFPLLSYDPFSIPQIEKEKIFLEAMRPAVAWHFEHSSEYRQLCNNRSFDPAKQFMLADIPYIPVTLFKSFALRSVPESAITKTLYSSSTSGKLSTILLDTTTASRQVTALNKILSDFLGSQRRTFLIFDTEATIKSTDSTLSSRGTALRGMLSVAKSIHFLLDDNLRLDPAKLQTALASLPANEPVCFFGFTWLIYTVCAEQGNDPQVQKLFASLSNPDKLLLHIGGWKKLKDLNVSKETFNQMTGEFLSLPSSAVIDFYGMTEQLGTVYPDCSEGYKHAPVYSEVLIRDIATLQPVPPGEIGFIELLSPLPHSYPGIAVLSDDLGRIVGEDTCPCGRKGRYFVFEKRSEQAEVKGCGDTINTIV